MANLDFRYKHSAGVRLVLGGTGELTVPVDGDSCLWVKANRRGDINLFTSVLPNLKGDYIRACIKILNVRSFPEVTGSD